MVVFCDHFFHYREQLYALELQGLKNYAHQVADAIIFKDAITVWIHRLFLEEAVKGLEEGKVLLKLLGKDHVQEVLKVDLHRVFFVFGALVAQDFWSIDISLSERYDIVSTMRRITS